MIGQKKGTTSQTFKKERQSKKPNVREIIFFLSLERGSAAKSLCRFPTIFASKLRLDSLVRIKRPLPDSSSSSSTSRRRRLGSGVMVSGSGSGSRSSSRLVAE